MIPFTLSDQVDAELVFLQAVISVIFIAILLVVYILCWIRRHFWPLKVKSFALTTAQILVASVVIVNCTFLHDSVVEEATSGVVITSVLGVYLVLGLWRDYFFFKNAYDCAQSQKTSKVIRKPW